MRAPSSFTHDFLLLFAGPLIWAVHFLAIYGFTGIVCARPGLFTAWLGVAVTTWAIVAAGIAAVAAIALCLTLKPKDRDAENRSFIQWSAAGLSLLSVIAIFWETVTVFLVPSCA